MHENCITPGFVITSEHLANVLGFQKYLLESYFCAPNKLTAKMSKVGTTWLFDFTKHSGLLKLPEIYFIRA